MADIALGAEIGRKLLAAVIFRSRLQNSVAVNMETNHPSSCLTTFYATLDAAQNHSRPTINNTSS